MTKPDIIISWPRNNDYPLWRQFIHEQRKHFNEIIVVFTDTFENDDYSHFVRETMFADHIIFVDNPPIQHGEDWRNVAIHQALLHSYNAEWIWFTEQDFFCKKGFFEETEKLISEGNDAIVVYDGARRMHPCSIMVKRTTLDKTRKNFGVIPDVSDHFSVIQTDLELCGKVVEIPTKFYFHMNGLSSNFAQVARGGRPNYQPEIFNAYIDRCMMSNVNKSDRFVDVCRLYQAREADNWKTNDSVFK